MSYAQALFEVTQEQNLWHSLPVQLRLIAQAVSQTPHLSAAFAQPGLTDEQKAERVAQLFGQFNGQAVETVLLRFITVLAQNNRLHKLSFIAEQYQLLVDKAQRVIPAEVTTVVPMTDDQKRRLVDTLKQMTGMNDIRLSCRVLPDILGGVVLKIQDLVVDGSTIGKLSQLRKQWC